MIVAQYEAADHAKPIDEVTVQTEGRTDIVRAVELFKSSRRSQGIGKDVLQKYDRELKRLIKFVSKRGRIFPHEILLEDLTDFRANWEELSPSSTTWAKVQERLRGFLRYCYESRMIDALGLHQHPLPPGLRMRGASRFSLTPIM